MTSHLPHSHHDRSMAALAGKTDTNFTQQQQQQAASLRSSRLLELHLGSQVFRLEPNIEYLIGSGKDAQIEINDNQLPARVASIKDDQLTLLSGAVILNNRTLTPPETSVMRLRDGDELRIGHTTMTVHTQRQLQQQQQHEAPRSLAVPRTASPSNSTFLNSRVHDKEESALAGTNQQQKTYGNGQVYGQKFNDSELDRFPNQSVQQSQQPIQQQQQHASNTHSVMTAGNQPITLTEALATTNPSPSQTVPHPTTSSTSTTGVRHEHEHRTPQQPVSVIPAGGNKMAVNQQQHQQHQQQQQPVQTQTTVIQDGRPVQQQSQQPQQHNLLRRETDLLATKEQPQPQPQLSGTLFNNPSQSQSTQNTAINNKYSTAELCQIMRDLVELRGLHLTSSANRSLPEMFAYLPRHHRADMTSSELKNWMKCAEKEREWRKNESGLQQQQRQQGQEQQQNDADRLTQEDLAYGLLRLIGQTPDSTSTTSQNSISNGNVNSSQQPRYSDSNLSTIFGDMLDVTGEQIEESTYQSFPHMISLLSPSYRSSFDSSQLKSWIQYAKELRKERQVYDGEKIMQQQQQQQMHHNSGSSSSSSSSSGTLSEMDLVYSLIGLPWYQQKENTGSHVVRA